MPGVDLRTDLHVPGIQYESSTVCHSNIAWTLYGSTSESSILYFDRNVRMEVDS